MAHSGGQPPSAAAESRRSGGRRTGSRSLTPLLAAVLVTTLTGAGAGTAVGGAATPAVAAAAPPATVFALDGGSDTVTGYGPGAAGDAAPSVVVGSSSTALTRPAQAVFDAAGDLWVADCGSHAVVEYTAPQLAGTGSPLAAVVLASDGDDDLACPDALAFDPAGDLWVASTTAGTHAADVVELTAAQLGTSGDPVPGVRLTPSGTGLSGPDALAFDPAGDLWVADRTGDDLVQYDPAQLAEGGSQPPARTIGSTATSLAGPAALAFDPAGDLWVADAAVAQLVELTPGDFAASGTPTPARTVTSPGGDLSTPSAIELRTGALWVAVEGRSTAVELGAGQLAAGGTQVPAVTVGSTPGSVSLLRPAGLAFDPAGDLWVVDAPTGIAGFLTEIAASGLSASADRPAAVTVSSAGTPSLTVPQLGAFDPEGDLWIADYFDDMLVELTPSQLGRSGDAVPAVTIGASGTSLDGPVGLAFDPAGDLWVAAHTGDQLEEYRPAQLAAGGTPTPSATVTVAAGGPGGPAGLAFDPAGDLWVAGATSDTLAEYTPGQLRAGGAPAPTTTITAVGGSLDQPEGVAFDARGDLLVVNEAGDSVAEYMPGQLAAGGAVTPAATVTAAGDSLDGPVGIAVDPADDAWVANGTGPDGGSLVEYTAAQLATGGAPAPAATLVGPATGLDAPAGVVTAPVPAVSGLTPESGQTAGGTDVTVEGSGFLAGSTVDFGAEPARSVAVADPSRLMAVAPPGTGAVDVTVSTTWGTSPAGPADRFVYATPADSGPAPGAGPGSGYWLAAADGAVLPWGAASADGSMAGRPLDAPVVGMAADPGGTGYWEVAADGGVFSFTAPFAGSMGGQHLDAPVVGMAADPSTGGYWLAAADGGVFSFDAPFWGSMAGRPLDAPVVGMAADPATGGYWLVAADGGVFSFDAPFWGSMAGRPLDRSIVGMAATPDGGGYWLVAADGGVFSFGDAPFDGSMGGQPLDAPVVGMAATPDGGGYWLVAADGGVFSFGDAPFDGSDGGRTIGTAVVGMAPVAT